MSAEETFVAFISAFFEQNSPMRTEKSYTCVIDKQDSVCYNLTGRLEKHHWFKIYSNARLRLVRFFTGWGAEDALQPDFVWIEVRVLQLCQTTSDNKEII